jgi:hypothetical protein
VKDAGHSEIDDALAEVTATSRTFAAAADAQARALIAAHQAGASRRQIARAAGTSRERVKSLLQRGVPSEGEEGVPRAAPVEDVVVMAATPAWPLFFRLHAAVVCEAHHSLRPTASYLAMFLNDRILPTVPIILHVEPAVQLNAASLAELRSGGEPYAAQVADIGEALVAEYLAEPDAIVQVIVCTAADDPRTITLPAPIRHDGDGMWVARQRYVPSGALRAGVITTTKLEEVMHTSIAAPTATPFADSGLPIVAFKLNVSGGMTDEDLYQRTRYAWRTNPDIHNPEYAVAVGYGIVRAVYTIDAWEPAPDDRVEFHGELHAELTERWGGLDVRAEMGSGSNPVRYFNC